jgi:hypothetical protein
MLFVLALLVASVCAASDVVVGSATVRFDFSGFSADVSVSTCDRATYSNQGGRVVTYTIATTNFREPCLIVITEGGVARDDVSFDLANGDAVVANPALYRATLAVHLERYNPGSVGNSFCVRLRVQTLITDIEPNVFRVYCDATGPVNSNRLPLSALTNNVVPSEVAYTVPVLRTSQLVTVWAEENTATSESVVFTEGHTAQGLVRDVVCSDGACDSGRLVAQLEVPLFCDESTVNPWPTTDVIFSWNSSPDEFPISADFRTYRNVPGGRDYYYFVLAADNYRVRVQYPSTSGATAGGAPQQKTVAAACYAGTCEAKAITSVLTVSIPGLSANVQLKIAGNDQWSTFNSQTGTLKYCVFNLVNTEVHATFRAGQTIVRNEINCETVNQRCNAGIFTSVLEPNFGCLTGQPELGPTSVQYIVYSQEFGIVHQATGAPATVLRPVTVPAFANLAVEVIEGNSCPSTYSCLECTRSPSAVGACSSQFVACSANNQCRACLTAADIFNPACLVQDNAQLNAVKACQQAACPSCASAQNPFSNGCVRWNLPSTDCSYQAGSNLQTRCRTVDTAGSFGRILSAFELFFLPADGVTVNLQTPDGVVYRTNVNQGGAARCYCILPSLTSVNIREGAAAVAPFWQSTPEDCLAPRTAPYGNAQYDCSVCDFLTILQFDLRGIPRAATSVLSASPLQVSNIGGATAFRNVNWVGNIENNVVALRSAGAAAPIRYWVTVNDNGATRSLSNVCSDKTCVFQPFTAQLCLNLLNPSNVPAGKGVCDANGNGLLTTSLRTASGAQFRSIPGQGCCNGCAVSSKRHEPFVTQCGRHTVLRNTYNVVLQERTVSSVSRTVDCNGATCSLANLINAVVVDTRCGTGAAGLPFIPTQRVDLTLLDTNGVQFRGPQSTVFRNCSTAPAFWSGPTCPNIGNMLVVVGVIQSDLQVRLEELRIDSDRTRYPDRTEHPIVTLPVSCSGAGASCSVAQGQFLSLLRVQSLRGLPNSIPGPASAALKYGTSQQNVLRLIPPSQLVAPEINQWCVLADDRAAYAVNWEAYASDGPNRPFTSCRSTTPAVDLCTTGGSTSPIVVPEDEKRK